jgi:glycosyltransferase involved in cell wall biosynthesis
MLSICIPTMNRWTFLKDTLPIFLEQSIVLEVILCDENGNDKKEIEKSSFGKHPKLKCIQNEKRLGIYQNKRKVGTVAKGDWVAILDSDNIFPEQWFEDIEDILKKDKEKKTIYASANFRNVNLETGEEFRPCVEFDGYELTKGGWNKMFEKRRWNFLLNDGNWIIPRQALEVLPEHIQSESLQAADAIFMLRCWIEAGYTIQYVKGLEYIHTVHGGSSWLETERESTRILNRDWRI